jgi:hypothetical protein
MRQVKSGVSHTSNRFGEPVAVTCSHLLRAVSSRDATFGVTHKRAPHVLTYAVGEVVPEGMKNLRMVVYAMCANVPAEPLGERARTTRVRRYLGKQPSLVAQRLRLFSNEA